MPTLQRVKNQARAVKCQANLHQWGLIFSTYTTDNDGKFWPRSSNTPFYLYDVLEAWRYEDLCFCPMAVKVNPDPKRHYIGNDGEQIIGSKFTAWGWQYWGQPSPTSKPVARGSYGMNWWVVNRRIDDPLDYSFDPWWRTCLVKRPADVPVFMDSSWEEASPDFFVWNDFHYRPPEYDDVIYTPNSMSSLCIDRHNGGINVLFMDWSVRKVGLKELWTLK